MYLIVSLSIELVVVCEHVRHVPSYTTLIQRDMLDFLRSCTVLIWGETRLFATSLFQPAILLLGHIARLQPTSTGATNLQQYPPQDNIPRIREGNFSFGFTICHLFFVDFKTILIEYYNRFVGSVIVKYNPKRNKYKL